MNIKVNFNKKITWNEEQLRKLTQDVLEVIGEAVPEEECEAEIEVKF